MYTYLSLSLSMHISLSLSIYIYIYVYVYVYVYTIIYDKYVINNMPGADGDADDGEAGCDAPSRL